MPPKKASIRAELPKDPEDQVTFKKITLYTFVAMIMVLYVVFLQSPTQFEQYSQEYTFLQPVNTFFKAVEKFSPFHEFLADDMVMDGTAKAPEYPGSGSIPHESGQRLFTRDELKRYDGSEGSPGLYLAMVGQVFDVSKGKDYYGPGGGYSFFTATDGSRAFVTGQFDADGLVDDVSGLSGQDYLGLQEWTEFYHKDYTFVGKLIGRFYSDNGEETVELKDFQDNVAKARAAKAQHDIEKLTYPPCNTEWSQKKGHRVWCTAKTGGTDRGWVGKPRKLYLPGKSERCACMKDFGPPSTDPSALTDFGDLKSPHVKQYEGCDPLAVSCQLAPPSKDKDEL
ncbi:hypothetical protein TCAL_05706 [Tigriopus californicus]|uniref:Cytochrome b5 heme-binding domain-containing protein n=1 Tax=Tigriopus californicus TaxID=6832 RepID=A0A553N6L0_TIGCA|nr:neuferricin-like [Tigriopus californicus]TRY61072.1 hypothetical protein TCAL_05706 [Tigriopus californicus]|eukprot:TCALIF_05706-PA protein Name:"Similar to Cyb5d2 Neuferricin (Rattus norvegicus)" AED:0.37 eAED:0.37 QI:0/-1/0/1/-1/1/1/0/338